MPLVIPSGHAHVLHSLRWANDPEPMALTYGISLEGGVAISDPSSLALALSGALKVAMQPRINGIIQHLGCVVRLSASGGTGPGVIGASGDTWSGTEASAQVLPQNSAYLVHKRSTQAGRGGRGRLFFPAVPEGEIDNLGNVNTQQISPWNTSLASWLTNLSGLPNVAGMVILHDSLGAFAATPPAAVTVLTLDNRIATQRRRLRK